MLDSNPNSKISLEDLLRVKRAERPSAEFWQNFERELRQKQLTALVQKRRWWHTLPAVFNRRVYLPAGAAAVVALSVMGIRYSAPIASVQTQPQADAIAQADQSIEMLPTTEIASWSRPAVAESEPAADRSEAAPAVIGARFDRDATPNVGLLPVALPASVADAPSTRTIAANLADLEETEPDLVSAILGNRVAPSAPEVQTVGFSEDSVPRKHRLVARYAERLLDPNPKAPAPTRERLARKLGDDLVGSFGRVAVEQGAVSVRF